MRRTLTLAILGSFLAGLCWGADLKSKEAVQAAADYAAAVKAAKLKYGQDLLKAHNAVLVRVAAATEVLGKDALQKDADAILAEITAVKEELKGSDKGPATTFKSPEAVKAVADYEAAIKAAKIKYGSDLMKAHKVVLAKVSAATDPVVKEAFQKEADSILAEKTAIETESGASLATAAGVPQKAETSWKAPPIRYRDIAGNGFLPGALRLAAVSNKHAMQEVIDLIKAAKFDKEFDGRLFEKATPNKDNAFEGGGKHGEYTYYVVYLSVPKEQEIILEIDLSAYGAAKLFCDFQEVLDCKGGRKNRVTLSATKGPHAIVIRFINTWADRWVNLKVGGSQLRAGPDWGSVPTKK